MAYTEKQLLREWINPVRFQNGNNVNLTTVANLIQQGANEAGIPVAFTPDKLKTGGLLNQQMEDILIMYNPQHQKDYLHFLIRVEHMGNYAFMHIYELGSSRNANLLSGGITAAGTIAGGVINKVRGTTAKANLESQYYMILADVVSDIMS